MAGETLGICWACGHVATEHADDEGCQHAYYRPWGRARVCLCRRSRLDVLYEMQEARRDR